MSRAQTYKEGEAAASQRTESNRGSKVRSERVALLLLSALLAAAAVVIYRLSFAHFQTSKNLQMLKDENEAMRKNLTAESFPTCEKGWNQHGGRCYHFSSYKLTWDQSRRDCKGRGADLVQIKSEEEQSFLEYILRGSISDNEDKFWIGLTDSEEEGRWLWVDDSPLNNSLSFWYGKEPDNWTGVNSAGEDCARMGIKGGATDLKCWFDTSCDVTQRNICEKAAKTGR
ncbi:C-type lectin domain family 4 member E-like [Betta splendens]|uniref:C-type lectin domain family 4 member E-like n=1 Tax=Betta splendens TaxID=158456 RepID=A0A8M1H7Q0_BETSP|nr:C-type lectin domain family 4 member E-like [Betta splendens]XP_055360214.1 C-type lectin domain family 4 member E-like [Betta splendens]